VDAVQDFDFTRNVERFRRLPGPEQAALGAVSDPLIFIPGAGALPISRRLAGPLAGTARQAAQVTPKATLGKQFAQGIVEKSQALGRLGDVVETPTTKLTRLINAAKPVRAETEALKSAELSRRAGAASQILAQGEGRQAFQAARGPLRGELPRAQFTPPEPELGPDEVTGLYNTIRDSDKLFFQKLHTDGALTKVLAGEIPTRGEILLLEDTFGPELARAVLGKRGLGPRALDNAFDAINLPRSIITSYDISAPLRQGAVLSFGHPVKAADSFVTMLKSLAKEKNALKAEAVIRNHPNHQLFTEHGLFIAERGAVTSRLARAEEVYMSRLAGKIPGIRASERAYTTYLNKLRFDVMNGVYEGWLQQGKRVTDLDLDRLANLVNAASGRGRLPQQLDRLAPALNAGFFSARYQASRIDLIGQYASALARGDTMLAGEIIREAAAFFGTGAAVLGGLKLSGVTDLEESPLSSDFGKLRIKGTNTRLDFWAGFQPYARYMAQVIANREKSIRTGETRRLSEVDQFGRQRSQRAQSQTTFAEREITPRIGKALRFGRSKLSPPASFLVDAGTGRNFTGEEFGSARDFFGHELPGLPSETYERITPLFFQDLVEAMDEDGLMGGFIASPAVLGAGAVTITDEEPDTTPRQAPINLLR
jgi:hypothetical protein